MDYSTPPVLHQFPFFMYCKHCKHHLKSYKYLLSYYCTDSVFNCTYTVFSLSFFCTDRLKKYWSLQV